MDDPRALLGIGGRHVVHRRSAEAVAVPQIKVAELGPAQAYGILQDCLKDRFQISGRRADNFEHFGGRRLLLQSFGKLARALLLGLEQPHVLNRNRRLVGECGQ